MRDRAEQWRGRLAVDVQLPPPVRREPAPTRPAQADDTIECADIERCLTLSDRSHAAAPALPVRGAGLFFVALSASTWEDNFLAPSKPQTPVLSVKLTNQEIYERVYAAISERRLAPGTKLSEERLAQVFHASRTRIREVLLRLSQDLIVETHPNRGAFVACPPVEDIRHVFAVRRALERAIVTELSARYVGQPIAAFRAHLESEARARREGDQFELARLTGEFHILLAEATGNRIFASDVRRLVALTSLIIAQHDSHDNGACAEHDHHDIVKAIEAGDARRAERLMLQHLEHVERAINPPQKTASEVNFERIFGLEEAVPSESRRSSR